MGPDYWLTVITPTTGKPSLIRLIESINKQTIASRVFHFLLWDDVRDAAAQQPDAYDSPQCRALVLPAGFGRNGAAPGSPLRAVGLMAAQSPWVTFADDDVSWDPDHAEALLAAGEGHNWVSTMRRIWSPNQEYLGVDRFESVGDDPGRRVPYEMCDNNVMAFRRELGSAAAPLYRETKAYNDDRLMYAFLKQHGGPRGRTTRPTVNHTCPARLVEFFQLNCARS
jgi:Glycosyl transferase family 2